MVSRKSPQGTCSPSTFTGEGTQGPSADRGSHFAQCLLPECKQSGPSESSSIETEWAGEGVGARAARGHGLRVRSGHKGLQEREDGCTRVTPGGKCLWGEHEVCVSPCRVEWWQGRSPRRWREGPWAAVPAARSSGAGQGLRAEHGPQHSGSSALCWQHPACLGPSPCATGGRMVGPGPQASPPPPRSCSNYSCRSTLSPRSQLREDPDSSEAWE